MISIGNRIVQGLLLSLIAMSSVWISRFIWMHAGLPDTRSGSFIWYAGIPIVFFVFAVFRTLNRLKKSQTYAVWIGDIWYVLLFLAHLVALISWRYISGWQYLLSALYSMHLLVQIMITVRSLDHFKGLHLLLGFSFMTAASVLLIQFPLMLANSSLHHWISGLATWALITAMVLIIRYTVLGLSERDEHPDDRDADRIALAFLTVVAPFTSSGTLTKHHVIAAICGLIGLIGIRVNRSSIPVRLALSALIIAAPMLSLEFSGTAVWAMIVGVYLTLKAREPNPFLTITGYLVILIASITLAVLVHDGKLLEGDLVWNSSYYFGLIGTLLDVQSGILLSNPLALMALAGFTGAIFVIPGRLWHVWIGPWLCLAPILYRSIISRGSPPTPLESLPVLVMIWPFIVFLVHRNTRPIAAGYRVCAGLAQSALAICFFSMLAGKEGFRADLSSLLADWATVSDVDLSFYLPHFSALSQTGSVSGFLWTIAMIGMVMLFIIERRIWKRRTSEHWNQFASLVFLTIGMLAIAAAVSHGGSWVRLDGMPRVISAGTEKQIKLEIPDTRPVYSLRIHSFTSNSASMIQGAEVVNITVDDGTDMLLEQPVRMGIDTAELAYDRPDVLKMIRHQRPRIARTWIQLMGNPVDVHSYRTDLILQPPRPIRSISLSLSPRLESIDVKFTLDALGLQVQGPTVNWGKPIYCSQIRNVNLDSKSPHMDYDLDQMPPVTRMRLVSNVANAAGIPTGVSIGQMIIRAIGGRQEVVEIRAGIDTAEWAYNRKDLLGRVQHAAPPAILSRRELDMDRNPFLSSMYLADYQFDRPLIPFSVTIRYVLSEQVAPGAKLQVFSVMFM